MDQLIIWRHADYDTQGLTQEGVAQVAALAATLSQRHKGLRVRIRTSTASRAWETAKIVARAYACEDLEKSGLLLSNTGQEIREEPLLEFIRGNGDNVDVLILVTHFEVCRDLPTAFGREFGMRIQSQEVQRGEAVIIDVAHKTFEKL